MKIKIKKLGIAYKKLGKHSLDEIIQGCVKK